MMRISCIVSSACPSHLQQDSTPSAEYSINAAQVCAPAILEVSEKRTFSMRLNKALL